MIRIVKMTFQEEHVPEFLEIFRVSQPKIEAFEGCESVTLLRDLNDERIMMTYSIWTGPERLEAYRQSELFQQTWAKTKVLFADKPQAWSLEKNL